MIPLGYMAKRIPNQRPEWLKVPTVFDIYSVSDCVNDNLVWFVPEWEHNGYWFFNSPEDIRIAATANGIDLQGVALFYYEAHELELDEAGWVPFASDALFETHVLPPGGKRLEGFDIVTCCDGPNSHSPLSCNSVAENVKTNEHCLFETRDEALTNLDNGCFAGCEPGPYRIYAVYSADWL